MIKLVNPGDSLVPKLQLGNSVLEAPASGFAKLELRHPGSQAGAWEPANVFSFHALRRNEGKFFGIVLGVRHATNN